MIKKYVLGVCFISVNFWSVNLNFYEWGFLGWNYLLFGEYVVIFICVVLDYWCF